MSDWDEGVNSCWIVYALYLSQGITERGSLMLNANGVNCDERQRYASGGGLILSARGVSSVFVYSSAQVRVGRYDVPLWSDYGSD